MRTIAPNKKEVLNEKENEIPLILGLPEHKMRTAGHNFYPRFEALTPKFF